MQKLDDNLLHLVLNDHTVRKNEVHGKRRNGILTPLQNHTLI